MANPTRRAFLQAGSIVSLAAAGGIMPLIAVPKSAPVIDTHLHCFAGTKDSRFPYNPRAPYRPEPAATPEHLLKCMEGAGVSHAIVVHPEPYQDDHRYLEYCLEVGKKRLKGTCLVFADQPASVAQLPKLAKRGDIVAVRVHAYAPDRLPPFGKPELRNLWKQATDLGLAVQLHFEPRYAPGFQPLIEEFRSTVVIIDHLGRPLQGTPEEHAVVIAMGPVQEHSDEAVCDSFNFHLSSPGRGSRHQAVAEAYGPDRMIYGGGFGADATPQSYQAARERARSTIAHFSAEDQAKVLGGTAAKLFGFAS